MSKQTRVILVDIFNWIQVSSQRPDIVTRGIYRHAHKLAVQFQPCFYLTEHEAAGMTADCPFMRTVREIEMLLGKHIMQFQTVNEIEYAGKLWLSIGLDNPSPVLPLLKGRIPLASVLHDVMSFRKVFGPQCEKNFFFGAKWNDVLLPVSEFSLKEYRDLAIHGLPTTQLAVPYGCFHSLPARPFPNTPLSHSSYSVSTVEPRKRIVATAQTALAMGFSIHHHIGAMEESENPAEFERLVQSGKLRWHRGLKDDDMRTIMRNCPAFFCLSSDEGFSMTPLEAILGGVPYVFLSDIPVHREIYGKHEVNFLRIGEMPGIATLSDYYKVSELDRQVLFHQWSWRRVIQPFLDYAEKLT